MGRRSDSRRFPEPPGAGVMHNPGDSTDHEEPAVPVESGAVIGREEHLACREQARHALISAGWQVE
ncbi:hypothetical protein [Saccharopolyspora sp. NPDC002376]